MGTRISYVDETWNLVVGCTKCSPGCLNCYAEKFAYRLANMGQKKYQKVISTDGGVWNNEIFCDEKSLDKPLHWHKSRRILCCSMGDLFHEKVPFKFIESVFWTMLKAKQHTFLVLTKRIDRALEFSQSGSRVKGMYFNGELKNVHLGVTICNQAETDEKIPILLQIPAAHRWLSIEPMLGEVSAYRYFVSTDGFVCPNDDEGPIHVDDGGVGVDWVVVGCESGHHRRPCKLEWIRSIVEQCKAVGAGCYVKQIPMWKYENDTALYETIDDADKYGTHFRFLSKAKTGKRPKLKQVVVHDMSKFPKDLQVRETI